ncbi:NADP-dependent oxidoreductase [Streptomyces sp. N2-109]|uniref:NADP-dependent oxidoreductase n=1 Tax=Streptomyces gossypii TaxID=2883101 RepID=A0ABT2JZ46_9ACTN|nr:NADP-dependent oxidoreductase [Streptomyces gossypii]MCT2593181.1 NADP-dependent oxidoreductase [Streptomyces gossypii]
MSSTAHVPAHDAHDPAGVPATHREVRLAARPEGAFSVDNLRVVEASVPVAGPGQVLVRNRFMSVAAVMLTLMRDSADLPMPLYVPGEVLWGPAIGEVITSDAPGLNPGDLVEHSAGWREYAALDAADAQSLDLDSLPDVAAHLSQGFTAWLGVVRAAEVRPGDTVFVSGAAGGVGSLAGQFARLHGAARVIGSTSSQRKADQLTKELGYDAVVLRGAEPIVDQLREAAPEGIDAVFDNVGGEQLTAALALANRGARIAVVGMLSTQASGGTSTPTEIDTATLVSRGITLRGIAGIDHLDALPQWAEEFGRGLREGTLTVPHVRLSGIEEAPRALDELLRGRHVGAVLVEL